MIRRVLPSRPPSPVALRRRSEMSDVIEFEVTGGLTGIIDKVDEPVLRHRWKRKPSNRTTYLCRNVGVSGGKTKALYLHRMIVGPIPDGMVVDHINGNALDNRRENLRVVSHEENHRNTTGERKNASVGFLGVERSGDRFAAKIRVDGKNISLGSFGTAEEANEARLLAEEKYWGLQPRRAEEIARAKLGLDVTVRSPALLYKRPANAKGYWKKRNRWSAEINVRGKKVRLGCFASEAEAASAYQAAVVKYRDES